MEQSLSKVRKWAGQGHRHLSWLFLVGLLCFMFPFLTISCAGQRVLTEKGYQMVFGGQPRLDPAFVAAYSSPEGYLDFSGTDWQDAGLGGLLGAPTGFQESDLGSFRVQGWAVAAFATGGVGALAGLTKRRWRGAYAALGGIAAAALLGLKASVSGGYPPVIVSWGFGYWIAFLAFLVAAVVEGALLLTGRSSAVSPGGSSGGPTSGGTKDPESAGTLPGIAGEGGPSTAAARPAPPPPAATAPSVAVVQPPATAPAAGEQGSTAPPPGPTPALTGARPIDPGAPPAFPIPPAARKPGTPRPGRQPAAVCSQCGTSQAPDARFCPRCGQAIAGE